MEIRENLLFGGISQENIDKILVCSKSNIKRYAQGEKVFFQGDEPRRLFVLLKGRVKFVKNLFSGKKQFLDEACEGGIFLVKAAFWEKKPATATMQKQLARQRCLKSLGNTFIVSATIRALTISGL